MDNPREVVIDAIVNWPSPRAFADPARPETIRVLRERIGGAQAMVAVEFEDAGGRHYEALCGAVREQDGSWRASGMAAAGSGHAPTHVTPWANFGGWGWPQFLCVGGRVYGESLATVRVIDAAGVIVEDGLENGIALLVHDGPIALPCTIELLDRAGTVLRVQTWPPRLGERTA
jgi:hypothetical protein